MFSPNGHGICGHGSARLLGQKRGLDARILRRNQLCVLLLHGSVGVELQHSAHVLKRVGPDDGAVDLAVRSAKHLADLLRLEQLGQIGVGHLGHGKVPSGLGRRRLLPGAKNGIQLSESSFGPNAESSNMTSGGELEKVQVVDLDDGDSRDVTESFGETFVLVIDDERSKLLYPPPVPQLTLTSSHPAGRIHLLDISPGADTTEEHDGILGLLVTLDLVGDDKRNLWDLPDLMSLGHDEGWDAGGRDGGTHGVSLLGDVDLAVPFSPLLGGSEHASTAAHVTVGCLAGTVGSTTTDTGDTSNGTSSTPGLSRSLVTCWFADAVRLPGVLCDVVVDEGDDVGSHRGLEHRGKADGGTGRLILFSVNADQRPSR